MSNSMRGIQKKADGFTQHLGSKIIRPRRILARFVRDSKLSAGFTITELLLATAIFSTVIVVALAAFLGIGRLFYKGVNMTQNQQVARNIMDLVSSDIQSSSTPVVNGTSGDKKYICVGSARYIYMIYSPVNLSDHNDTDKFGLLRDTVPGSSGCADPYDGPNKFPPNKPTELLGNGMRLNSFSVGPDGCQSICTASIDLATGDDDPSTPEATCNSNLSTSQYCAKTQLTITASKGL